MFRPGLERHPLGGLASSPLPHYAFWGQAAIFSTRGEPPPLPSAQPPLRLPFAGNGKTQPLSGGALRPRRAPAQTSCGPHWGDASRRGLRGRRSPRPPPALSGAGSAPPLSPLSLPSAALGRGLSPSLGPPLPLAGMGGVARAWLSGAWRRRKKTPLGGAGPLAAGGRCGCRCLCPHPFPSVPAVPFPAPAPRVPVPGGRRRGPLMWGGGGGGARSGADGDGVRRGGRRPQLLLQGGAARGGLRGENLPGAALLREQVQRQAHHHPAGAGRAGPGAGGPARSYGDGAGGGGVRCSPSLARSPGCPAGAGPRGPAALPRPGPVERSSVSPRQDLGLVCRLTAGGGTAAALEGVPVPFRVSWKLTFWIFLRLRL